MSLTDPPRRPRIVPSAYILLSNWRYIEHSLLRMIAGWGRSAGDWEDKLAVCNHVWLQAQIVDRLRHRAEMFPGGKADQPVSAAFQDLCNTVLLAPSFTDAMAGIHAVLNPALLAAYRTYIAAAHPVHDRPTADLLHEVMHLKLQQAAWYESFRARYPKPIVPAYDTAIRTRLAQLGGLLAAIEPSAPFAAQCGVGTDFAMPKTPGRVKNWDTAPDLMPFLESDWSHSVEARRLYFMVGYCREMGVAEQQLRWIYHADFMPWEFVLAESRHQWDESRHGDSGYHRLKDFGFDFEHFGYSSYNAKGEGNLTSMTPREVYEGFYFITQIAETGFFETKRYCFDDFLAGGDEGSAEMMQYDIIDETSHVEYGRDWLVEMARRAGAEGDDYKRRGAADRALRKQQSATRVAEYQMFLRGERPPSLDPAPPGAAKWASANSTPKFDVLKDPRARKHYDWMLQVIREKCPLKNVSDAPLRPVLPM